MDVLEGQSQRKSHQEYKIEQGLEGSEQVSQTSIGGKSIPSRGNKQIKGKSLKVRLWNVLETSSQRKVKGRIIEEEVREEAREEHWIL